MANKLAGLAALAALGYGANKFFNKDNTSNTSTQEEIPTTQTRRMVDPLEAANNSQESQDIADLAKTQGYGDQYIPSKKSSAGTSTRTPAKAKASTQADARDRETGTSRGSRAATTDARDREAGMSRGTRYGSSAYETPSYTGKGGSGRGGQGGPTANELARYVKQPNKEETQAGLETMMGGGPGLKAINTMAKGLAGRTAAKEAMTGGRALATTETPVTYLGARGSRQVGGYDELSNTARQSIQNNPTRTLANNPTRQLPGGPSAAQEAQTVAPRRVLDESDTTGGAIGYRKGGAVKKMAKGGMTSTPISNASRRADGIASKGKTRGKIY